MKVGDDVFLIERKPHGDERMIIMAEAGYAIHGERVVLVSGGFHASNGWGDYKVLTNAPFTVNVLQVIQTVEEKTALKLME